MTDKIADDYECFECQDRGFIYLPDGTYKKCICQIKKDLLVFLGEFANFRMLGSIKNKIDEYSKMNIVVRESEYNLFGNICKTILAMKYLDDNTTTYEVATGNDLINGMFTTDDYGNTLNLEYYNADYLILKLGRDNLNKAIPDLLLNLLTYRIENKKPTIVFIYKEVKDTRLKQHYGEIATNILLKDFKRLQTKRGIL